MEEWNEEEWVGSCLAACMWIFTEAVACGRKRDPLRDLQPVLGIVVDNVSWVSEDLNGSRRRKLP